MVCRSNPASSVVIALARNDTWLDDAQVQSIFHRLRHDPISANIRPPQRGEMVARVFRRAGTQIESDPTLRPQRRAGLQRRLEDSRSQTDGLANDTLSAMERLQAGVLEAQIATEARLREIAGRRGMSAREARQEFATLRTEAPSGRQARATREELLNLGSIPSDPATRYALRQMESRPPLHPPVRLVQHWIPVEGAAAGTSPNDITHLGVSELSNRVELRQRDGQVVGLDPAANQDISIGSDDCVSADFLSRLRSQGRLRTPAQTESTAYAVRCDDCGRFIGDRPHDCPVRAARIVQTPQHVTSNGAEVLRMPSVDGLRTAITGTGRPAVAEIDYVATDSTIVRGTVSIRPGGSVVTDADRRTRQRLDIDDADPGELTCQGCRSGEQSCRHVAETRRAIRRQLERAGRLPSDRAAQSQIQERLHQSVTVSEPSRAAAELAWTAGSTVEPTLHFSRDPEVFRAVIREASPDRVVPFMDRNALHGYAAGVRFGVELEFNATDYGQTREAVARSLYEAGIIRNTTMHGYHTAARNGYRGSYYNLESDGSVPRGGELVTSIESDHPDSWARLRTACEAISNSGATTDYAGSHTNISSPDFTPEHAWRLAHLVRHHEDDLLRCGRTPNSRRERHYNATLPDPGPTWSSPYDYAQRGMQRESMVNFTRAFGRPDAARIEFRFPDASHNPGVIQAQIKLAAAMTNYVRTNPVPEGERRPMGSAQREGWTNRMMSSTPAEWEARTHGIRHLIDNLFTRDEDRSQLAILWARGRYVRS